MSDLTRTGRVLVVGSINVDLVVEVARLPGPGETVLGGAFSEHNGGKSANQAVAAARLGAQVELCGCIGDDAYGEAALAALRDEGIGLDAIAHSPSRATGIALIAVDPAGENQIAVASGANDDLTTAHAARSVTRWSEAGPPGVVLLGLEIPDAAVLGAATAARRAGATVVLNPAPARPISDELYALRPILTPNAGEAAALIGDHEPEEAARALARRSHAPVLVTLGRRGAVLLERPDATPIRLPAEPVTVVDTTGAGDTLNGALAAALAAGTPLSEAARRAVRAAGLSTRAAGSRAGMPQASEVGLQAFARP